MNDNDRKIIKKHIWDLEQEIENINKNSVEYKILYEKTLKLLEEKKKILKSLQEIVKENEKPEKFVKDILAGLVDEENSRIYVLQEISKIRREKLKEEDQKDFDDAVNFLKSMIDKN